MMMRKIAIIPARSGSKGLPNKNVLLVDGKPLISYSVEAAIKSKVFDEIIVTTDSQEYIDILSKYNKYVKFIKRDLNLALDGSSSYDVIIDVLNKIDIINIDYFVLLQPTSPLRNSYHIQEACNKFENNIERFDFLVSMTRSSKSTALIKNLVDDSLVNFDIDYSTYTRQKLVPEYTPNGAIFIGKPSEYKSRKHFFGNRSLAFEMDKNVSIDIDDKDDFEFFYYLCQRNKKEKILLENIKNRILTKLEYFKKVMPITLIGHSILDQWNVKILNGISVNNLAISGISTRQYIDLILDQGLINNIGDKVILMTGVNDIVKSGWVKEITLKDVKEIISKIKDINSKVKIYFLEIIPVCFRMGIDNRNILDLNTYLKDNLDDIIWLDLYDLFSDEYKKLDIKYTDDGLHLNQQGYYILKNYLELELSKENQ